MDPTVLLKGALPPIAAALLLVSICGRRGLPLAAGIGLYLAYGLLKDWPAAPWSLWHQPNGTAWLVWGTVGLAAVSTADHLGLFPGRLAPMTTAAAGAGALWLMLTKMAQRWSGSEAALHIGVGGVSVALTALAMRGALARSPRSTIPAVMTTLLLSLDAGLVTLGKSALLGQLCGAVAAAIGAAVGTTIWRRGFTLAAADGAWIGGAHALFLLAGVHLGYLAWAPACCALAAPLTWWLLQPAEAGRAVWWTLRTAPAPFALMAVALWLAMPADDPYAY